MKDKSKGKSKSKGKGKIFNAEGAEESATVAEEDTKSAEEDAAEDVSARAAGVGNGGRGDPGAARRL